MQKKIALIEFHHHSEVLRTFAQLLCAQAWEIKLFTHQGVREDLYELEALSGVEWYIRKEEKAQVFLSSHASILADCDLIIWVTLFTKSSFFHRPGFKGKNILIVHNVNTFFAPHSNLTLRKKFPQIAVDLFRLARFWIFREAIQRQKLLEQFDFISLASPVLQDLLYQKSGNLKPDYRFIQPLPFAYFEGIPEEARVKRSIISIGISGTVTEAGRNYEMVLAAFRQLVPELQSKIRLTLLGGAQSRYAQQLTQSFQKIQSPYFEFLAFPNFIPQKEFDTCLRTIDFLILPLKKSYPLGIIREEYGRTNISGGINDLIRFGIPALVSTHYPLEPTLEKLTAAFKGSSDLLTLLQKWIVENKYLKLRQLAPEVLAEYRKEVLGKKMEETLKNLSSQ